MRPAVKFCGFTQNDDLEYAINLGIDAIGLVFYDKSPRFVDISTAKILTQNLPPFLSVVALVVNMTSEEIVFLSNNVAFDVLQFHGDESPAQCQALAQKINKRWYKAIRVETDDTAQTLLRQIQKLKDAGASAVLLDAYHPQKFGGTGVQFDWGKIPTNSPLPIILAGGLTADNVGMAIKKTGVYGVDVSGGIEYQKGKKDKEKMEKFINQVKYND